MLVSSTNATLVAYAIASCSDVQYHADFHP